MSMMEENTPQEQLDYLDGKINGIQNALVVIMERLAEIDAESDIPEIINDMRTHLINRFTELNEILISMEPSPPFLRGLNEVSTGFTEPGASSSKLLK